MKNDFTKNEKGNTKQKTRMLAKTDIRRGCRDVGPAGCNQRNDWASAGNARLLSGSFWRWRPFVVFICALKVGAHTSFGCLLASCSIPELTVEDVIRSCRR